MDTVSAMLFFLFLLSRLELSDTKVCGPSVWALLGTALSSVSVCHVQASSVKDGIHRHSFCTLFVSVCQITPLEPHSLNIFVWCTGEQCRGGWLASISVNGSSSSSLLHDSRA